jgi:hypothetical protein
VPTGTALTPNTADAAPAARHWLIHQGAHFVALLPQATPLAPFPSLDRLRARVTAAAAVADGMTTFAVGLSIPGQAPWPAARQIAPGSLPVLINRRDKDIVMPVDPATGAAAVVVKLPRGEITTRNCSREHALLVDLDAHAIRLGPAALARDDTRRVFTYEHLGGETPADLSVHTLVQWTRMLERDGTTSARAQAERCRARIDGLPVGRDSKDAVHARLDRVTDATQVPLAVTHGDLTIGNFVRAANRQLRAFDWEFCDRESIGILDLIQLCHVQRSPRVANLGEYFSGEVGARIARLHALAFPEGGPRVADLLTLAFCLFYVQRVEMVGLDSAYLRQHDRLMRDRTPL